MAYSDTEIPTRPIPGSETSYETKETLGEAKQATEEIKNDVKQEAQRITAEAKQRGQALFDSQKHAAADEIGNMALALRRTAQELNQEQQPSTAKLATRAADSLERLAGTLRDKDLRTVFSQLEHYAREHPGMFFGGSVVAGLLLARFLKSSAEGSSEMSGRARTESRGSQYAF